MTDVRVKLLAYGLAVIALVGAGFAAAWFWQANAYGKVIATNEANRQADLAAISNAGAKQARDALAAQQAAEARAAAADEKYTKEKADDLAKNETLRRAVADGTRRLRIAASCSSDSAGGNLSKTTSAASLGDASTIELPAATGRAVLDLRASIIADQAALMALQQHIRDECN